MDFEKIKQFYISIGIIFLLVASIVYVTPKIIEEVQTYQENKMQIENKQQVIKEKQQTLEDYQRKAAESTQKELNSEDAGKPFFKPIDKGLDTETVISDEFAEILTIIRANKIKVRSIKYDYDPKDDAFVAGAPEKYNVARLNMEMVSNYPSYESFLKELYKHKHFMDIQSAEIVPYKKNKRVLLINFKVKLYARK